MRRRQRREMMLFGAEFERLPFPVGRRGADVHAAVDEHPRRRLPGVERGEIDAGLPRDAERLQAGVAQILVKHADRRRADHVAGTGDRKSGNRQAAG